jgi:N-methylhydantoinase A/oxoprolinase/acetone carboxylase beta subunit
MKIGIDFGITHTDVAISNDQGTNFQTFKSLDINQDLKSVFDLLKDPHNIKKNICNRR